jgi:putative ABC transport system substrate-binding protein
LAIAIDPKPAEALAMTERGALRSDRGIEMKRRDFFAVMGAAAAWPLAARAQQPAKMPHVVYLSPADIPSQVNSYRAQLRELGYFDGRNIVVEFRNAGGFVDRLPALAEEIVRQGGIDVILAISTPAALAAHRATQTIPIVAFTAVDPVTSGLAKSLAHPGGNVTGIAVFSEETTVKRMELMREVVPRAARLAVVITNLSKIAQDLGVISETGRKLGFDVAIINVDDHADLAKALSPEVVGGFDALVFIPDIVLSSRMAEVIRLIGLTSKPAIFPAPDWVNAGGLMSFGPDFAEGGRYLVAQLDRVLKGEKPGDLPFVRPTKFDFRINLRTALTMGIELSPTLLARADEVIE